MLSILYHLFDTGSLKNPEQHILERIHLAAPALGHFVVICQSSTLSSMQSLLQVNLPVATLWSVY
jgi:hypothetical protein